MSECNIRHHFFCLGNRVHFPVCISSELACDGYNNCPFARDDENPEECGAMMLNRGFFMTDPDSSEEGHRLDPHHIIETILKKAVLKTWDEVSSRKRDVTSTTTSKPMQNILSGLVISSSLLRNMSDILLKKFLNKNNVQMAEPMNVTVTTTIKPPWQDDSQGKPLWLLEERVTRLSFICFRQYAEGNINSCSILHTIQWTISIHNLG